MNYPKTPKLPITEEIFGHTIIDPYRWLEDGTSQETQNWTQSQMTFTQSVIATYPGRDQLRQRLKQLRAIPDLGLPHGRGETVIFQRRDPNQKHAVLYAERHDHTYIVADPNQLGSGEPMNVDWADTSHDGRYVLYGLSEHGNEWSTLHIYDLATQTTLADRIPRARYSSIAFAPESKGFYYTRYPQPGEVPTGDEFYLSRVFYHEIGEDYRNDRLIFSSPDDKRAMPQLTLSESGQHLIITLSYGWTRMVLYHLDLSQPGSSPRKIFDLGEVTATPFFSGERLLVLTNAERDCGQIVELHLDREEMTPIIVSDDKEPIIDVAIVGDRLFIHKLHNAVSVLAAFTTMGVPSGTIPLPNYASIVGLSTDDTHLYYGYTGFSIPMTIEQVTESLHSALWAQADTPDDNITVKQEWVTSDDGTRFPMFIAHRADWTPDGPRPTVLSGYGGFAVANLPAYSASIRSFIERGGVYALATLRGGSEFGESWHRAGMMDQKQNVFDDFKSAAHYLIAQGYTDSDHLGVSGRSNGGLLTGTFLTQNPHLAKAAIVGVPLLDMVRFHKFLIADLWTQEYGSPEDADAFQWIYRYSPYHHVVQGESYPATFLFTSEEDGRVDPLHAKKMAALLQAANHGESPILLRVLAQAGHGVGKSVEQWLDEEADIWTFLSYHLGLS